MKPTQTRLPISAVLYQRWRILMFQFFSYCKNVEGHPVRVQPVQLAGVGSIRFYGRVLLGFENSPAFLTGYTYIEARTPESVIEIHDGVHMNNNCSLISEGAGISIGKNSLLGFGCEILDSDFHNVHPDLRTSGKPKMRKVVIGENVLLGANVKILKGVHIGNNSIVQNGAVVTRSVPENSIAYGKPIQCGPLSEVISFGERVADRTSVLS